MKDLLDGLVVSDLQKELMKLSEIYYEYNKRLPTDADVPRARMEEEFKTFLLPDGLTIHTAPSGLLPALYFMIRTDRCLETVHLVLHPSSVKKCVVYEAKRYG